MSTAKAASGNVYSTRPAFKKKFPGHTVKRLIHDVLVTKLSNQTYRIDASSKMTKEIADEIKNQLKALELPRYKYMVQVVIGEQKGEGLRMGTRCLWDTETDSFASQNFSNDSLFCVATAYGVYLY